MCDRERQRKPIRNPSRFFFLPGSSRKERKKLWRWSHLSLVDRTSPRRSFVEGRDVGCGLVTSVRRLLQEGRLSMRAPIPTTAFPAGTRIKRWTWRKEAREGGKTVLLGSSDAYLGIGGETYMRMRGRGKAIHHSEWRTFQCLLAFVD